KNPFFVFITFLIFSSIFIPYVHATTKKTIYATKDSYVSSYDREINYGGQNFLYLGIWNIYEYEVYLYFDLDLIKLGWNNVYLYLDFSLVSDTMEFEVFKIVDNWDEFSINWNNKPSVFKGLLLFSFQVSDNGLYNIKFKPEISENSFSMCIRASDGDNYASLSSREGSNENYRPRLEFEYASTSSYYLSIIFFVVIIVLIGCSLMILIYIRNYKKMKKKRIEMQPPISIVQSFSPTQKSQQIPLPLKYCPNCGTKIMSESKFCEFCGSDLVQF
ncbi:MAG: DNRLRE domain-containing protein, partial [Promethearchaeota archaeon]